jgi:hypothetical protein
MSSFLPSVVDRLQAKAREFLRPANKKIGIPVFRLRESTAWKLKDMPWCPRRPQLTPEELQLLHRLRQELSYELGSAEIDDCDVLLFALQELQLKISESSREDLFLKLRFHLWDVNGKGS